MNLWFDLKYAWRLARKSWGYSLMCASVVAFSVGLAVWTNALVYSQVFKPLGFPGAERWYSVQIAAEPGQRLRPIVDAYTWQELLKQKRAADHLGAIADRSVVLSEGEATTSLRGVLMSPRLFASLRTAPLHGRAFVASDGQPGSAPVAILTYDTWQRYFAGDPAIVGKTARIDAAPAQIVGVMPKDFFAFDDYEILLPLHLPVLARPQDSSLNVSPLIALHEGQSVESIAGEMKAAVGRVNAGHPDLFHAARRAGLIPAHRMYSHNVGPIMMMMSLMAVGVLLLGCMNVSMVFLARLLERSRELALRTALGSSRARLMRQCLLETAVIVLLGLIAGCALAFLGIEWTHGIDAFTSRVMASGRSSNLPMMRPFDLVAAVIAAVAVWLLSTLIPAWRIARQDAAMVLAGSGKGATVRAGNRSAGILVGLQVVISCLVLMACGNMVFAVNQEIHKPTGLETARVMVSTYATTFDARYKEASERLRYWDELAGAVESKVPGAELAVTTAAPSRPVRVPATIESRQGAEKQGALKLPLTIVSENYFALLGIRLRSGRLFDGTDDAASLDVAIVDESMAARFWPDGDALGKRVRLNTGENAPWLTIVGVVSNVPGSPYRPDAELGSLYQPLRQALPQAFQVLVRLPDANETRRAAIRAAAFAVDRDLPLHNLQTLDDYLAALKLGSSAMVTSFIAIALITALLAASGLFGLISRSVAQRTQEVGIRRALGATAYRATSMFLRQGAIFLTVGVIGLGLGVMVMPLMSRAIPNILDHILPVSVGVVVLMAAVISTASYLPTRRAVALEPGDALRYE